MKKYLCVFFAILVFCICIGCQGWTRADTYRQVAGTALLAVDWMQTREISQNPDRFYERNPILGSHPRTGEVDTYFAASAAATWAIAAILPSGFWREAFQYGLIGVEAGVVIGNHLVGVRIGF